MAEFSSEYIETIGSKMIPDFSYLEELIANPKATEVFRICEGFGSIGVKLILNEPHLIFLNSESKPLSLVIDSLRP
nr:hypothetical protein [uncultured Fluviicola sp.]